MFNDQMVLFSVSLVWVGLFWGLLRGSRLTLAFSQKIDFLDTSLDHAVLNAYRQECRKTLWGCGILLNLLIGGMVWAYAILPFMFLLIGHLVAIIGLLYVISIVDQRKQIFFEKLSWAVHMQSCEKITGIIVNIKSRKADDRLGGLYLTIEDLDEKQVELFAFDCLNPVLRVMNGAHPEKVIVFYDTMYEDAPRLLYIAPA